MTTDGPSVTYEDASDWPAFNGLALSNVVVISTIVGRSNLTPMGQAAYQATNLLLGNADVKRLLRSREVLLWGRSPVASTYNRVGALLAERHGLWGGLR